MKTILVDAVDTIISDTGVIFEDIHNLMEEYPNKKLVVTNAAQNEFSTYGIDKLPYEFFTLEHQPNKTDPKYFQELFTKYSLNSSDVVYFEHNPDAVKSAESLGIVSMHFDHQKRDIGLVKNFLDSNL